MMEKIKSFFSSLVGIITLVVTGVIGILLWRLSSKRHEVNALKAKIALVETQKQADLLEAEIRQRMANKDSLDAEAKELQKTLNSLETKRKELAAKEQGKTSTEIEEFWRKNQ